ncbi:MAG: response regulator transcription factor [Lachnospiraceae bacterium]|nr:response regulator transcription factor [Lachnospiraceae bacterium]
MRVILLDDDQSFLKLITDNLKELFISSDIEVDICSVYDISEFEKLLDEGEPDVVFLDIDIPEKSGIEIADELRKRYEGIDIIFLTNREDLVFQSIHYLPFRFIRKSKLDLELKEAVDSYIKYYIDKKVMYTFEIMGEKVPVFLSEIIYMESEKHYIKIHNKREVLFVRGNIGDLEKKLNMYKFIRIQRSFLVNLRHITKVTGKSVLMSNGDELNIKRGSMEYIRNCFFEYRRERLNGADK